MRYKRKQKPQLDLFKPKETVFLDDVLDQYIEANGSYNVLVPWYLITSYLYYVKDISIITDKKFDWICKKLLKHWKEIKHTHKKYIERSALRAGTGYYIKENTLPSMCLFASITLHQKFLRLNKLHGQMLMIYAGDAKKQIKRYRRGK